MRRPPRAAAIAALTVGVVLVVVPVGYRGHECQIPGLLPAPVSPDAGPAAVATAFLAALATTAPNQAPAEASRWAPPTLDAQLPRWLGSTPADIGDGQRLQVVSTAVHPNSRDRSTVLITAQLIDAATTGTRRTAVDGLALTVRLTRTPAGWRVAEVGP